MKKFIVVLCIILLVSIGLILLYQNNQKSIGKVESQLFIIIKGYDLFGCDYCECLHFEIFLALMGAECMLCENEINVGMRLCGECANKINRCNVCGKIEKIDKSKCVVDSY